MAAVGTPSLLTDYPALQALDDAWSPAGALNLFNDIVLPLAWPGRVAAGVTVEDVSHIPGRSCIALYALRFDGEAAPRRAVATFAKDDRLTGVFNDHYGGDESRVAGERARPVALIPERRCLVEFFGMDWKLPALAEATDSVAMAPLLSGLGCGPLADIEILRYRPHQRCVLRYACEHAEPARHVIGKVFRRPEQAARVWETLRALHSTPEAIGLVIPAPLALVDGSLLLTERVEGLGFPHALAEAATREDAERLVVAAAAAATALHALPAGPGEAHTFQTEVAALRGRIVRMAAAAPRLAREANAVLDRLCGVPASASPECTTLVHGDFKPDQLVLTARGIALLDFDRAGPGDPAVDLGNFMAQLHREALTRGDEGMRALAERFVVEYEQLAGAHGVAVRARCFRTLALVRMAVRRLVHSPHLYARSGASSPVGPFLAEAASCLD